MKKWAPIILALLTFLLASCQHKEDAAWEFKAPEFTFVGSNTSTYPNGVRSVSLSASLSSVKGIVLAGFMFGSNEASMEFYSCPIEGNGFSLAVSNLAKSKKYCFYAVVGNGRNQLRTPMQYFTSSSNDKGESGESRPTPDNPWIQPPPPGVGITVSDKNFLDYLLSICDSDKDGAISVEEATAPQSIEVCTDEILTLDGIAYFSSLNTLKCDGSVWKGMLSGLALASNSKLEDLSCSYNQIEEISLPSSLKKLVCRFNKLSCLNTEDIPLLVSLDCYGNAFGKLELSNLHDLEELTCGLNSFTTLDISSNLKLKYLDLRDATNLKTVYVARGQRIETIIADNSIDFKYKE